MDEDAVFDFRKGLLEVYDGFGEPDDGFHVVVLRVKDPDHGANAAEDAICVEGGVEVVYLAGEIPHLEIHEGTEMIRVWVKTNV